MFKSKCKLCGRIFKSEFKGRDKGNLAKHVKNKHGMFMKDYVLKYEYDGVRPICACGCGKYTNYYKQSFLKYFKDHKNYIKPEDETINKIRLISKRQSELSHRLKLVSTSPEILKKSLDKFKTLNYSLNTISKEIGLDKRTLKKFWIELEYITDADLEKLGSKTKYIGFRERLEKNRSDLDYYLEKIMLHLDINSNDFDRKSYKMTINQIINELNIPLSPYYILRKLKEKFGGSVLSYFKLGDKSNIEIDFFNVLKFYYNNRVKLSFKLEDRYYDYIIDGKYLIELDGTYWHSFESAIENDKYKNELALNNGFEIIRISEKEVKNISILNKINKIINEV